MGLIKAVLFGIVIYPIVAAVLLGFIGGFMYVGYHVTDWLFPGGNNGGVGALVGLLSAIGMVVSVSEYFDEKFGKKGN